MARTRLILTILFVLSLIAALFAGWTGHRVLTDDTLNPDIGLICFALAGVCLMFAVDAALDLVRESKA